LQPQMQNKATRPFAAKLTLNEVLLLRSGHRAILRFASL
jgi:hypothetical protein